MSPIDDNRRKERRSERNGDNNKGKTRGGKATGDETSGKKKNLTSAVKKRPYRCAQGRRERRSEIKLGKSEKKETPKREKAKINRTQLQRSNSPLRPRKRITGQKDKLQRMERVLKRMTSPGCEKEYQVEVPIREEKK